MSFLLSFELSLRSLLLFFALPFFYFGYHSKFWYAPSRLQTYDFLLRLVCILLGFLMLVRLIQQPLGKWSLQHELLLLHLVPLVLTLLIVNQGKRPAIAQQGAAQTGKSANTFRPVPLNREIQKIGWNDLIISENLRQELISVMELLRDPSTSTRYGIEVPKGILLNGPPGTGKTTIAKVIANTAHLSFFVLQLDEIVSKWVGESEKNLSILFDAALRHAPSVIFVDEIDSIGKTRSGNQVWADNLLNHLLQLIDGVIKSEGIYIIAATNRADLIDPALKRAGRLNKVIEIGLPDFEARANLFALYMSRLTLADDVDLAYLAQAAEGKSPADIKEICNQAGLNAFKRESQSKKRNYAVTAADIETALGEFLQQT